MDISALLKLLETNSISKTDFREGFKTVQRERAFEADSIFTSIYMDSDLDSIFSNFDVNGDGTIDEADKLTEEILGDELMTEEDLEMLVEEFTNMFEEAPVGETPEVEEPKKTEKTKKSKHRSSSSSNSDGDKKPTSKDYSKMSADQLKSELSTAKNTLAEKQEILNNIINGSDSALKALQDNIDSAQTAFQNLLQQVAPELAEKYKQAKEDLDNHNQAINDKNVAINEKQASIDSLKSDISNLDGQISSYESAIVNLEAEQGKEGAPDDLGSRIADLRAKKQAAEDAKTQKQSELDTVNTELEQLKSELSDLEAQTSEKEQAVQALEVQISELNNEELNTLKEAVTQAQSEYDAKRSSMMSEAQAAVTTAQAEVNKIQAALDARQKSDIENEGKVNKMPTTEEELAAYGFDTAEKRDAWNHLVPEMKEAIVALTDYAKSQGIKITYNSKISIFRTYEEQARIYKKSRPGYAAKPGHSRHESGEAVDITIPGADKNNPNDPKYKKLAQFWEGMGYTWGGRWNSCEPWHFDLRKKK